MDMVGSPFSPFFVIIAKKFPCCYRNREKTFGKKEIFHSIPNVGNGLRAVPKIPSGRFVNRPYSQKSARKIRADDFMKLIISYP
jgi:hypothetical protein